MSSYVRAKQQYLAEQNRLYSPMLQRVPPEQWPPLSMKLPPVEVWRSRDFLMQVYVEHGRLRLSVCRTAVQSNGRWAWVLVVLVLAGVV